MTDPLGEARPPFSQEQPTNDKPLSYEELEADRDEWMALAIERAAAARNWQALTGGELVLWRVEFDERRFAEEDHHDFGWGSMHKVDALTVTAEPE